jgi:uncharacterized alkaline shock family protein YloU
LILSITKNTSSFSAYFVDRDRFYHNPHLITRKSVLLFNILKGRFMDRRNNPLGNIYISHRAIATVAYQSALESYGVVGLAAKNMAEGLVQVIVKDPTLGVEVQLVGNKLLINLYIIVEYGTRIASVATSVAENVKFRVENVTGLEVDRVNVNVRGLRISNPD